MCTVPAWAIPHRILKTSPWPRWTRNGGREKKFKRRKAEEREREAGERKGDCRGMPFGDTGSQRLKFHVWTCISQFVRHVDRERTCNSCDDGCPPRLSFFFLHFLACLFVYAGPSYPELFSFVSSLSVISVFSFRVTYLHWCAGRAPSQALQPKA